MTDTIAKSVTRPAPKVSVIIPYRNNISEVDQIVLHLKKQNYSDEMIEIIIIDNGSESSEAVSHFTSENTICLQEKEYKNSPYSARNRGVEAARGEILAFIDANSHPADDWIENGVSFLIEKDLDIAAGAVHFDFGEKITAAKITDSLTSIQMKKAVEERGAAYTANLFVRRSLFEKAGLFEEGIRSGGDVRWTINAVKLGFKIGYAEKAVVYKKARTAKELYQKKIRTGKGYFFSWKEEDERTLWFYNFFRALKPPSFSKINTVNEERYQIEFGNKRLGVWFHLYATGIVEQTAFMWQYLRYVLGSQRDIDRRERMKETSENAPTE
ncbi:MAG: glycosyltransferase [Balneolaceae bacterium]|nr:glycosyltransferase [Balneolaceae bacterium]